MVVWKEQKFPVVCGECGEPIPIELQGNCSKCNEYYSYVKRLEEQVFDKLETNADKLKGKRAVYKIGAKKYEVATELTLNPTNTIVRQVKLIILTRGKKFHLSHMLTNAKMASRFNRFQFPEFKDENGMLSPIPAISKLPHLQQQRLKEKMLKLANHYIATEYN